jgi:Zn finger protein HypA/HybF involved in hydrogenase expression
MRCPNCQSGDMRLVFTGRVILSTDLLGRPCGNTELSLENGEFTFECQHCGGVFPVAGWAQEGRGAAILCEEAVLLNTRRYRNPSVTSDEDSP